MYGQRDTQNAGDTERATAFAQSGLEVARNYAVSDFDALTPGDHGIRFNTGTGQWEFSGLSRTQNGYTLVVTLSDEVDGKIQATAKVTWELLPNRPRTLILSTLLARYGTAKIVGNWSNATLTGSCVAGTCTGLPGTPLFNGIAVKGDYAYVGSEISSGGAGLYLFDVSDAKNPQLVDSFSLGAAVYDLAIRGDTLYMVMARDDSEVRAYDIGDPLHPLLVDAFNFPDSGMATSLALDGSYLYVAGKGLSDPGIGLLPERKRFVRDDPQDARKQGILQSIVRSFVPAAQAMCISQGNNCLADDDCCTGLSCHTSLRIPTHVCEGGACAADADCPADDTSVCPQKLWSCIDGACHYDEEECGGASSSSGLSCLSPYLPEDYLPESIILNGADVQCLEECNGANPRWHVTCFGGAEYPFCTRQVTGDTIGGETETQYLSALTGDYAWEAGWDCDGECTPDGAAFPLCEANISPFVYDDADGWIPDCSNGLCQQPPLGLKALQRFVLCPADLRMKQCALENDGVTAYSFIPDGDPCDSDDQCYHGSNQPGWRPYSSICRGTRVIDAEGVATVVDICSPPTLAEEGSSSSSGEESGNGEDCETNPCEDSSPCGGDECIYDATEPDCYICQDPPASSSCRDAGQACTDGGAASDDCCSELVCEGVCKTSVFDDDGRGFWPSGAGHDFYSFDISDPEEIAYLDSLYIGGGNDVALTGSAAYVASPLDTGELIVVSIADPDGLVKAGQYNMSDRTEDGRSVALNGTSALIGTERVSALQEFALFTNIKNQPVPASVTAYHEGSGSIVAIDTDPSGCYAFYADAWNGKELQVIELADPALPERYKYPASGRDLNGPGRGMYYQMEKDRLYLTTDKALYIFSPAHSANDCS